MVGRLALNDLDELRGIGWAVDSLNFGMRVRRRGWNGKGMFLEMQFPGEDSGRATLPGVLMSTADHEIVNWTCSMTDLLAEDWELVVPEPVDATPPVAVVAGDAGITAAATHALTTNRIRSVGLISPLEHQSVVLSYLQED